MNTKENSNSKKYLFFLEGEWIVITDDMLKNASSENISAILRLYDANRKKQERASRCYKTNGARCMGKCSECKEYRSGAPLSLEQFIENGYTLTSHISVEEQIIKNELYQALYTAIDTLDEKDKLIILLYFFEEKTERQIANLLGLHQKSVNYRKNKSLEKLKELLKDFT